MRWLLGWCYISSLHSADESQQGQNSCPLLQSCFIGSCHVCCLKTPSTWYQLCSLLSLQLQPHFRPSIHITFSVIQKQLFSCFISEKPFIRTELIVSMSGSRKAIQRTALIWTQRIDILDVVLSSMTLLVMHFYIFTETSVGYIHSLSKWMLTGVTLLVPGNER